MGNVWYNEPKTLDVAFDVISDVTISAAAMQYGGFTIPRVDTILAPYAEKSYHKYKEEYFTFCDNPTEEKADEYATAKVYRDMEQGFQSWEYRFNTVGSSRGDYPFISISFGVGQSKWETMASSAIMKVRAGGQGAPGHKKPVLFPKLTFLYDENLHGEGKPFEWLFDEAVECSSKAMYPDFLSLSGNGYIPSMYKKYGQVVSLMGCRASLSPWYVRGGMEPADEDDYPVFEGRFNLGAITLHLPMILAKARHENKDFYEVLDYYLEMIRQLHKKTYDFLGEKKASINPLGFCEGGFYGGTLNPEDKILPILKPMTMSFGITALNELQELYNGKSITEDGQFALEVMKHINEKVAQFKKEDGILYALYGTPAESLCFHGDTEVQCYGGNKKIKDIKAGDLVYSLNEELNKIELKEVIASEKTKKHAVMVKVTFDNGQNIICTPDHPIGVRRANQDPKSKKLIGGEKIVYIDAIDLKPGYRIKSNYIRLSSHGRPKFSTYSKNTMRCQLQQEVNAEYAFGEKPIGYVIHHKDRDKTNNSFENLVYLTDKEHRIEHMEENFKEWTNNMSGKNNPFYGKKHTVETKNANRNFHIGRSIERFDLLGNWIEHFDCADDAEAAGFTRHLLKQACCGKRSIVDKTIQNGTHYYKNSLWYYTDDCQNPELLFEENHKVKSVEVLNDLYDAYDIEVKDNHNFFVGGNDGVLVHNCGLQVEQFRKKYGIVKNVSDRPYVSNSFHCGVWEDISPVEKQDLEERFWDMFNGGKIQYCRYPIAYNKAAIKSLVKRAMEKGFYEGINLALSYCEECGYEQLDMDVCPKCGSNLITKIDRMNGYLGYTRVHGKTRYNDAKMAEIKDRVSM